MQPSHSALSLLATGLLALPAPAALAGGPGSLNAGPPPELRLARGGGGGSGFRGGGGAGMRGGGGRGFSGAGLSRPQTGFAGGGGLSRGDRVPVGGFSQGDRLNRVGSPALNPAVNRPAAAGSWDRRPNAAVNGTINANRTFNANRNVNVNRNWNRQVNLNAYNLNPGWARPGWGVARPWNWGWYGTWSRPPWGWWGASAAVWGISSLATAAMINSAVTDAINSSVSYIVVPETGYELQYGTVQPSGDGALTFVATANGSSYQLSADCNAGLLNGIPPASAAEAQLLNAACQVAFGSAS